MATVCNRPLGWYHDGQQIEGPSGSAGFPKLVKTESWQKSGKTQTHHVLIDHNCGDRVEFQAELRNKIGLNASFFIAGWSSLAARRAHNPKVVGSNPTPATKFQR